jgi:hypothetical protein
MSNQTIQRLARGGEKPTAAPALLVGGGNQDIQRRARAASASATGQREPVGGRAGALAAHQPTPSAEDTGGGPIARDPLPDPHPPGNVAPRLPLLPVQTVRAGLEYTEASVRNNNLRRFVGHHALATTGGYQTGATTTIRGVNFTAFHVPNTDPGTVGAPQMADATLVVDGRVSLTNDTVSPEWKIQGHGGGGVTRPDLDNDINDMFAIRTEFKNMVRGYEATHAGDNIVFTPTANVNPGVGLNAANEVYEYTMSNVSTGSAQITAKFRKPNSIKRISEVNVGKYLAGDQLDNDRAYLSRTDDSFDDSFLGADWRRGDQGYYARKLRGQLRQQSVAVHIFEPDTIATIKMMILSDTMSVVMSRYNATFGQTHDKSQQRYFPKSHRPQYIHALLGFKVSNDALNALQAALLHDVDALTATFAESIDLKTLNTNLISQYTYPNPGHVVNDFQGRADASVLFGKVLQGQASRTEQNQFRVYIFGAANAFFKARLREVIRAYTDVTVGQTAHEAPTLLNGAMGQRGTVVSSFVYANVDPTVEPGAVYERRHPEVEMAEDNLGPIHAALDELFAAAE